MTTKQPIAVLGGGSFGTAIANLLAENGHDVLLWMRDEQQAESIRTLRQNPRYLKGIDLLGWLGWYGPAKLPEPIVQRLNRALVQAHADPKVKEDYGKGAYESVSSTPAELAALTRDSHERWGRVIRELGMEVKK